VDSFSSFDVTFEKVVDRVRRDDPGLSRDEAVLKASELPEMSKAYARRFVPPRRIRVDAIRRTPTPCGRS
jgi:hypothetical protein